eukprot:1192093-Prorocentrum_minimum.AAC.1
MSGLEPAETLSNPAWQVGIPTARTASVATGGGPYCRHNREVALIVGTTGWWPFSSAQQRGGPYFRHNSEVALIVGTTGRWPFIDAGEPKARAAVGYWEHLATHLPLLAGGLGPSRPRLSCAWARVSSASSAQASYRPSRPDRHSSSSRLLSLFPHHDDRHGLANRDRLR